MPGGLAQIFCKIAATGHGQGPNVRVVAAMVQARLSLMCILSSDLIDSLTFVDI